MGVCQITAVLILAVQTYQTPQESVQPSEDQTSILRQLDRSINPCDDFYQFSCGNNASHLFKTIRFLSETAERRTVEIYNEPSTDHEHHLVKFVKKLFKACVDVATIEKEGLKIVKEVLGSKLGGWPLLTGRKDWNEKNFTWTETTYKLRELGYMFPVFLDVLADQDKENGFEVAFPRAHQYMVGNSSEVMAYIFKIATAFGADRRAALLDIEDIVRFGEDLQDLTDIFADAKIESSKATVDEYQKTVVDDFDWVTFINRIVSPAVHISKRDVVKFPDPVSMHMWLGKIETTPKRVQANYMMWKVVEQLIPYLSADLQRFRPQGRRADFCLKEIERRFPINPITVMYLRKFLPKPKKAQIEQLVNNVKSELALTIKKFDWILPEEQKVAIDKVNSLKVVLGLPGNYYEDDILDQLNVDMMPIEKETFLGLLAQANRNLESQKYTGVIKRLGFPGRNYLINYDSKRNLMYVPASLLNAPLYDETRPNYLNYGSIGLLIAGELSGIYQAKYTSEPDKQQLTNSTKAGLEKMRDCVIPDLDLNVFASETDLTTVRTIQEYAIAQRVVYEAYGKWAKNNGDEGSLPTASYTSAQLFWISTVFCDPKRKETDRSIRRQFGDFRVYTALRNNADFGRDFNCQGGARMNPVKKCTVY